MLCHPRQCDALPLRFLCRRRRLQPGGQGLRLEGQQRLHDVRWYIYCHASRLAVVGCGEGGTKLQASCASLPGFRPHTGWPGCCACCERRPALPSGLATHWCVWGTLGQQRSGARCPASSDRLEARRQALCCACPTALRPLHPPAPTLCHAVLQAFQYTPSGAIKLPLLDLAAQRSPSPLRHPLGGSGRGGKAAGKAGGGGGRCTAGPESTWVVQVGGCIPSLGVLFSLLHGRAPGHFLPEAAWPGAGPTALPTDIRMLAPTCPSTRSALRKSVLRPLGRPDPPAAAVPHVSVRGRSEGPTVKAELRCPHVAYTALFSTACVCKKEPYRAQPYLPTTPSFTPPHPTLSPNRPIHQPYTHPHNFTLLPARPPTHCCHPCRRPHCRRDAVPLAHELDVFSDSVALSVADSVLLVHDLRSGLVVLLDVLTGGGGGEIGGEAVRGGCAVPLDGSAWRPLGVLLPCCFLKKDEHMAATGCGVAAC